MKILILLIWLLFDLIAWTIRGMVWLAGALIQLFIVFPVAIFAVLGGALLWILASYARWILLLLLLICGAFALTIFFILKWLKRSEGSRRTPKSPCSRRISPVTGRETTSYRDRNFFGSGEVYMTASELKFGAIKSVYIKGHLFEVRIPGGRSPGSILQLSGKRLRSEPGCTGKPSDREVLSIKLLTVEEA